MSYRFDCNAPNGIGKNEEDTWSRVEVISSAKGKYCINSINICIDIYTHISSWKHVMFCALSTFQLEVFRRFSVLVPYKNVIR